MSDATDRLFRNLAEFAPDALFMVDANGVITYANAYAHTLFGYEAGSLRGLSVENLIPAKARDAHVAHRREFLTEPTLREMSSRTTALFGLRRDGTQFRAEVRLSPIFADDGWVTADAVRDATEHDRVMTIVSAAREAAEQANEAKSRFVAAVSHDLRQPLQTLRVTNAILQRQIADASIQIVLQQEKQSLDTMSELLNALLNLSKLESGTIAMNIGDVALNPLLDDLRRQFEAPAAAKKLRLEFDSENDIFVGTDRALFADLLQNLIANAIRYTDTGCVSVRTQRTGSDRVAIEISDTGIGIPSEALSKIWDDFYQVTGPEGSVHRGGTGLGLAIVRRIAEILNVAVKVRSVVGQGTCFTVEVSGAQTVAQPASAPIKLAEPVVGNGRKIIFVEDDEAVRSATSMYLKLDGYSVYSASSLQEVDRLIDKFEGVPALIISDFRLKRNEFGTDAIAKIRAKFGRSLPAIMLTGDVSIVPTDALAGTRTRLLDKPIDVGCLTNAINELLSS